MSTPAGLALEGGDPREAAHPATHHGPSVENELMHASHDTSVSFEEYIYYAKITRAEEKAANERHIEAMGPKTFKSVIKNRFSKGHVPPTQGVTVDYGSEKDGSDGHGEKPCNLGGVTDNEWRMASRATRTAGWSGVFYLITTDILGPFSVP